MKSQSGTRFENSVPAARESDRTSRHAVRRNVGIKTPVADDLVETDGLADPSAEAGNQIAQKAKCPIRRRKRKLAAPIPCNEIVEARRLRDAAVLVLGLMIPD